MRVIIRRQSESFNVGDILELDTAYWDKTFYKTNDGLYVLKWTAEVIREEGVIGVDAPPSLITKEQIEAKAREIANNYNWLNDIDFEDAKRVAIDMALWMQEQQPLITKIETNGK